MKYSLEKIDLYLSYCELADGILKLRDEVGLTAYQYISAVQVT